MPNQTNRFSRNQILKAGVFIAGSAASSLILDKQTAQAQFNSGTFSTVTAERGIFSSLSSFQSAVSVSSYGDFNFPQILITQKNTQDYTRIRFRNSSGVFWDIATNYYSMNFFHHISGDVMKLSPGGKLEIKGTLIQGSSKTLKKNITKLSSQEALKTLENLNPVKYRYKADPQNTNHIGFIAEDVPDLVATPDRQGLSAMDIVGVLTKVIQEQQKTILTLTNKVAALEAISRVS
jgi:hypothetical protein